MSTIAPTQDVLRTTPESTAVSHDRRRNRQPMRRLLVVGSLYFKLRGIRNPDKAELDTFNSRLHLACRSGALMFPAAIAAGLWRKVDPTLLVNRFQQGEVDIGTLSRELIATLPAWFRYGDGASFATDVLAVLDCLRTA